MRLSRLIGEEAESPGLGLALEVLVLFLVAVFVGMKSDLLIGLASALVLDFLGIRRFLQRRRTRLRFQRSSEGDPLADVDGSDFMRGWWQDLLAAGFYALAFSMIYPTALAYLELGMLHVAIPLTVASVVAGLPPLALAAEGLTRLYHWVRCQYRLRAGEDGELLEVEEELTAIEGAPTGTIL